MFSSKEGSPEAYVEEAFCILEHCVTDWALPNAITGCIDHVIEFSDFREKIVDRYLIRQLRGEALCAGTQY
jgi:hypothetical protein